MHYRSLPVIIFFFLAVIKAEAQSLDAGHYVPVDKSLSEEWKKSLWSNGRKAYKGEKLKTIAMRRHCRWSAIEIKDLHEYKTCIRGNN